VEGDLAGEETRMRSAMNRAQLIAKSRIGALPGEFLQAQVEG